MILASLTSLLGKTGHACSGPAQNVLSSLPLGRLPALFPPDFYSYHLVLCNHACPPLERHRMHETKMEKQVSILRGTPLSPLPLRPWRHHVDSLFYSIHLAAFASRHVRGFSRAKHIRDEFRASSYTYRGSHLHHDSVQQLRETAAISWLQKLHPPIPLFVFEANVLVFITPTYGLVRAHQTLGNITPGLVDGSAKSSRSYGDPDRI